MKEKKRKEIHLEKSVGSLNHLDNCESFVYILESLIYLKICFKIVGFSWYVKKSLPFVSRFTSTLMIKGSQLRLLIKLNNIPLLSVYLSQSKRNGENFHMGRHSYRKHLIKF
jgi:hypothetical protein